MHCLQIELITSAKARLLYNAGITSLEQLACSDEDSVAQALALGLRNQKPSDAAHKRLKIGKTGAQGTNALVARDAKQLLEGTSSHPTFMCNTKSTFKNKTEISEELQNESGQRLHNLLTMCCKIGNSVRHSGQLLAFRKTIQGSPQAYLYAAAKQYQEEQVHEHHRIWLENR